MSFFITRFTIYPRRPPAPLAPLLPPTAESTIAGAYRIDEFNTEISVVDLVRRANDLNIYARQLAQALDLEKERNLRHRRELAQLAKELRTAALAHDDAMARDLFSRLTALAEAPSP